MTIILFDSVWEDQHGWLKKYDPYLRWGDAHESLRFFESLFAPEPQWVGADAVHESPQKCFSRVVDAFAEGTATTFCKRLEEALTKTQIGCRIQQGSFWVDLFASFAGFDWAQRLPVSLTRQSFDDALKAAPVFQPDPKVSVLKLAVLQQLYPSLCAEITRVRESVEFFESLFVPGTLGWTSFQYTSLIEWLENKSRCAMNLDQRCLLTALALQDSWTFGDVLYFLILCPSALYRRAPDPDTHPFSAVDCRMENLTWAIHLPFPLTETSFTNTCTYLAKKEDIRRRCHAPNFWDVVTLRPERFTQLFPGQEQRTEAERSFSFLEETLLFPMAWPGGVDHWPNDEKMLHVESVASWKNTAVFQKCAARGFSSVDRLGVYPESLWDRYELGLDAAHIPSWFFGVRVFDEAVRFENRADVAKLLPSWAELPCPLNANTFSDHAQRYVASGAHTHPTEFERAALRPWFLHLLYPDYAARIHLAEQSLRFFNDLFERDLQFRVVRSCEGYSQIEDLSLEEWKNVPSEVLPYGGDYGDFLAQLAEAEGNTLFARLAPRFAQHLLKIASGDEKHQFFARNQNDWNLHFSWGIDLPYPLDQDAFQRWLKERVAASSTLAWKEQDRVVLKPEIFEALFPPTAPSSTTPEIPSEAEAVAFAQRLALGPKTLFGAFALAYTRSLPPALPPAENS